MPTSRRAAIIAYVCQGTLAAVFLVAGVFKLLEGPFELETLIGRLELFPPSVGHAGAVLAPYVEIALAAWLVIGVWPRAACAASLALLIGLTTLLGAFGWEIGWSKSCGCLGPFDAFSIRAGIVRNVLLLGACVVLLRVPVRARLAQLP